MKLNVCSCDPISTRKRAYHIHLTLVRQYFLFPTYVINSFLGVVAGALTRSIYLTFLLKHFKNIYFNFLSGRILNICPCNCILHPTHVFILSVCHFNEDSWCDISPVIMIIILVLTPLIKIDITDINNNNIVLKFRLHNQNCLQITLEN